MDDFSLDWTPDLYSTTGELLLALERRLAESATPPRYEEQALIQRVRALLSRIHECR